MAELNLLYIACLDNSGVQFQLDCWQSVSMNVKSPTSAASSWEFSYFMMTVVIFCLL